MRTGTVDLRTAEPEGYACSRVMCIAITHEPIASIEIYRMGWRGVQEDARENLDVTCRRDGYYYVL